MSCQSAPDKIREERRERDRKGVRTIKKGEKERVVETKREKKREHKSEPDK